MSNNVNYTLNSSMYDPARKLFSYNLPIQQDFRGRKVSLVYCSIYKQFFNITQAYNNNTFSIKWINGTVYNFTFPDGYYEISDINAYITYEMFQNGLYCNSATASIQIINFIQLLVNATRYGSQLNMYPVPTASQATTLGYSIPTGATWSFPVTAKCPTITFSKNFGLLFGFEAGTYGGAVITTSLYSTICPQISKVNNLIVLTNLVNSSYTTPNNVLTAMPVEGSFGSLLVKSSGQLLYTDIASNTFREITVSFSDQDLNSLAILDTEICIILSVVDSL